MKIIVLSIVGVLFFLSYSFSQGTLTYKPRYPKAGDEIVFSYQLPKEYTNKPDALVVKYIGRRESLFDVELTKSNDAYVGKISTDTSMNLIVLSFQNDKVQDNSSDKVSFIPLYSNNKIKELAYLNEASFHNFYGWYRLGAIRNDSAALQCFEKEFELYPDNRSRFFSSYLSALYKIDQEKANAVGIKKTDQMLAKGLNNREDYNQIQRIYATLKDTAKANFYKRKRLEKIPYDEYNEDDLREILRLEKDVHVKESLLKTFNKEKVNYTGPIPYTELIGILQGNLINQYMAEKNWEALERLMKTPGVGSQFTYAQAYRKAIKDSADWHFAVEFAKRAVHFSKLDWESPPEPIPNTSTYRDFVRDNKNRYGSNAYNYSLILSNLKQFKEALPYIQEAAFQVAAGNNIEYNSLYATIASHTLAVDTYTPKLEEFVKSGKYDDNIISILKKDYRIQKKGIEGFDIYITRLKSEAKAKLVKSISSKKLNEKSFSFELKDIEGRLVRLKDYKNKVVIIDFWATWCRPCIASFPTMHSLAESYKSDSSVVFLYINTFERFEDQANKIKEFILKNKLNISTLVDTADKVVRSYNIESIPYRIIIGKDGYIKFRSLGFPGNEVLKKELSIMIDLAKK